MQSFEKLEQRWAEFNKLDPAGMVACSSGTAAIHLALEIARPTNGAVAIMPDLTMIACARAAALARLKPWFVDCKSDLNMDEWSISLNMGANHTGEYVAAILAVHIYGASPDMKLLAMRGIGLRCAVIEDLAEAHGIAPDKGSHAACWSFYKNKIVAGEEGGAVWFANREWADKARRMRSLGFTDKHDFMHEPYGHNYRMSNAHAELILPSIDAYPQNVAARWQQWEWLQAACPAEWRMPRPAAPWVFPLRIPGMDYVRQGAIVAALQANGIAARMAFKPCHMQPEFAKCRVVGGQEAERASREVIYLPLTPGRARIDGVAFGIISSAC